MKIELLHILFLSILCLICYADAIVGVEDAFDKMKNSAIAEKRKAGFLTGVKHIWRDFRCLMCQMSGMVAEEDSVKLVPRMECKVVKGVQICHQVHDEVPKQPRGDHRDICGKLNCK